MTAENLTEGGGLVRAESHAPGYLEQLEQAGRFSPAAAAEHLMNDAHEIIRLLSGIEQRISEARADIQAARGDILELAGKIDGLEAEFGPLARRFSTTAGRLSATGAAAFTRRRSERGTI